jgi:hypothetical protein
MGTFDFELHSSAFEFIYGYSARNLVHPLGLRHSTFMDRAAIFAIAISIGFRVGISEPWLCFLHFELFSAISSQHTTLF